MIEKTCEICNITFKVNNCRKLTARFCSAVCRGYGAGIKRLLSVNKRLSTQGYFYIKNKDYHRSNKQGYAKIADIVLEEKIGRKLEKNEIAHHVNGNRTDDTFENLEVMTKKDHDTLTTSYRWDKYRKLNRWSKKYNSCRICNSVEKKHTRFGLCTTCSHLLERGKINKEYLNNL